jgi:hypothetical protein
MPVAWMCVTIDKLYGAAAIAELRDWEIQRMCSDEGVGEAQRSTNNKRTSLTYDPDEDNTLNIGFPFVREAANTCQ